MMDMVTTGGFVNVEKKSVLILGVYLSNQENNIEHIVRNFSEPCKWNVIQKWIAIGEGTVSELVKEVSVLNLHSSSPKFVLLNRLLAHETLTAYDFIIICDDDITLPENFLNTYLDLVVKYDFAMAQPARTHNSYIDHHFVEQLNGLAARRTLFVEIGPFFSVRKDLFPAIFPFDGSSFMGWGCDFVWPRFVEDLGLRMGIVDATPVEHSMRKPVNLYNYDEANESMKKYLSKYPHLSKNEAFRILESYA